jgi:hypothetical protein
VGNLVTSHRTVGRNTIIIKAPHITTRDQQVPLKTIKALLAFDKRDKRKAPSEWSTIEA